MKYLLSLALIASLAGCTNLDDAKPARRSTFVHFYGGGNNFEAKYAQSDSDGGYILLGNINLNTSATSELNMVIIKTNDKGEVVWEKTLESSSASAVRVVSDGYLIIGDSIELNPESTNISELVNTRARIIKMNQSGDITTDFILKDPTPSTSSTDFKGYALSPQEDGTIVALCSFKVPGEPEKSMVIKLSPDFSILWEKRYELLNYDYKNARTLYVTSTNNLLWASTAKQTVQNLSQSYLSISYVAPNSTFDNNSLFGENDSRNYSANDFAVGEFGYGVVGTTADQSNQGANIYFAQVDKVGNILQSTVRYFDGIDLLVTDKESSRSEDQGNALAATRDNGFVLAGSTSSIPGIGAGGNDIILIKIDAFGNLVWNRRLGGTGDETVSSIQEASDGGFVLSGSVTIGGQSSMFIMKTNSNGELVN